MMLTMGVSLYTSRVVLETLGIENYGIYSIVGGVIVMFGFLNSSMSGATSRFLTFELGRNDYEKLKKIFSAALTIHFIIAIAILILGETIGLWWLENKLVIPPERMNAARWVYHLSIISSMIDITQVPYNATIIAHERMNVYAYVEILNSLLKLGIVYLLVVGHFDKLILYAVLTLCVTIIITTIYKLYCSKHFSESRYKFAWNKDILHPMLKFSGWDLYGNMCVMAKGQGVNILLNLFFGVAINAAYGIANQVQGVVSSFSSNFLIAVRPQIVKYYAAGEIENMQNLMINSAKYSFLLMFFFSFPLILENHFVLHLWLKNVPDYAVIFCQINLLSALTIFMLADSIIVFATHATGRIKNLSILGGTIYILVLPSSYFLLKAGFSPIVPFVINIILAIARSLTNMACLKSLISHFSITKILMKVTLICLYVIFLSSLFPIFFHITLDEGWIRFFLVIFSSILSCLFVGYFVALDREIRMKLVRMVLAKLKFRYA